MVRSCAVRLNCTQIGLGFSPLRTDQVKDPWTFNQITRGQPSRIGKETVQPFQSSLLDPQRRATLVSGEKVDRSTDAQPDASCLRVICNMLSENFLLWHSYCQKDQRSLCVDYEVDTFFDFRFRFDKSHGRRMG